MKKFFGFIFASVLMANAANWYASPSGTANLATGGTTPTTPWNADTLNRAKTGGTIAAGDIVYCFPGIYTLTVGAADSTKNAGTQMAITAFIGIKTGTTNNPPVFSDWTLQADTANFPHINYTTHPFKVNDWTNFYNFYFYGDSAKGVFCSGLGGRDKFTNCVFRNTATSSTVDYIAVFNDCVTLEHVLFISPHGKGISLIGNYFDIKDFVFDHISDATNGIGVTFGGSLGAFNTGCFIANKVEALNLAGTQRVKVENTTFDSNTIDINATTAYSCIFKNNIHRYAVTGCYYWSTLEISNVFMGNSMGLNSAGVMWHNVDVSSVYQDFWATSGDPKVTAPGTNYSLQSSSPCINAAYVLKFGVQ